MNKFINFFNYLKCFRFRFNLGSKNPISIYFVPGKSRFYE